MNINLESIIPLLNKNLKIVILSTDSGEKYLSNICEL